MSEHLPRSLEPIVLAFDRHAQLLAEADKQRLLRYGAVPAAQRIHRPWARGCSHLGDLLIGLGMRLKEMAARTQDVVPARIKI